MPTVKKQRVKKTPKKRSVRKPKRRKTGSVLDRIAPVSVEDCGIKLNIYGRSGTGKTTIACDFPKPLLHIVCSAIGLGESRSVANVKGIHDVELRESSELDDLTYYVSDGNFSTVVLDHATELQGLVLKEIMGLEELPAQASWGMASREQYGQCALQVKERLRKLLGLRCHVVIIAQEREFNTEGGGDLLMPFVASALTPSITGWLNPACDYICHTLIRQKTVKKTVKIGKKRIIKLVPGKGVEFCLRTSPNPVYTTKFRVPKGTKLPDVIVDPTFAKLNRLIQGD